jgi:hypothetical protein
MSERRIFYFCFSHNRPRGGNKHSYRHVDILNSGGLWAAAFHLEPGFSRYQWFENDTRVVGADEFRRLYRPGEDLVVLPEDLGAEIASFPGRKVIFNKNVYYGATSLGRTGSPIDPYLDDSVEAAFAVSEHNAAYLRMAYPGLSVFRLYPEIDGERFAFRSLGEKKALIATNGKARGDVMATFHLLRARAQQGLNGLSGFSWTFLEDLPQSRVIDALGDALFFLFLSTTEGFGRMPVEAMACGAVTLAYSVGATREFLPEECRFEVGDVVGIARRIESLTPRFATSTELERLRREGRARAERFSLERQRRDVLQAWQSVLAGSPDRPQRARASGFEVLAPASAGASC